MYGGGRDSRLRRLALGHWPHCRIAALVIAEAKNDYGRPFDRSFLPRSGCDSLMDVVRPMVQKHKEKQ